MFQRSTLGYDNFIGRLAIGRMYQGVLKPNQNLFVKKPDGTTKQAKITKLFTFEGLVKKVSEVYPGDIAMIAGIPDIFIGDTITTDENAKPLPAIAIDEPTIALNFWLIILHLLVRRGSLLLLDKFATILNVSSK